VQLAEGSDDAVVARGGGMSAAMSGIDQLKERLPDHARDLRINLGVIALSTALTPAQAWTIAVAAAHTTRSRALIDAVEMDGVLAPEALAAARGAAAIMGMNNVYYRFQHFVRDGGDYAQMPARLRMQLIGAPGIDKLDFELACLAASAITGCESCVRAHEHSARDQGGTKEMILDAVRIAAVLQGVAIALA
jgi:lipoyl-dependent peroxiredoxin subunit D